MTSQQNDALAKKRYFAISAIRITGALLVFMGFALIGGGLVISGPPYDRWVGVLLVLLGAFDFAVMPKILARRWRTPRDL